jgi:copper(I)-binding protein
MMKRLSLLAALGVIIAGAFFLNSGHKTDVTLIGARAMPVLGQDNLFVVTLEIQNHGAAKTLTSVHSSSATAVSIMNPGYAEAKIVIPAHGTGIFAMDGAHLMLIGAQSDFIEGSFLPLTLEFADYGDVKTRVLHAGDDMGMAGMDHSTAKGVQTNPSPSIQLTAKSKLGSEDAEIVVSAENFTFVRTEDDAAHVPFEGHGHIYLNGLKLGRLYENHFTLGALPNGTYDLTVSLNSNNHQPYIENNIAIGQTLKFVHR